MSSAPFVVESVAQARTAHASWRQTPMVERLRIVREVRRRLVDCCEDFALAASSSTHPPEEVMFSEVLPLLEACKFLERSAAKLLAPERLGRRGRPVWLWGVASVIHREPFGVIGIISPSNYPLFLA
jgi:acyl-CoA reductase-like NAD-dependent aldehyde dehydrogenase